MFTTRAVPTETPQQVHDAMARGEIVLIDVREPSEFAVERIHGALLFPLSTFDPAGLPDAVGKQVVLQCGSGKRSEMAFRKAFAAGVKVTPASRAFTEANAPVAVQTPVPAT